MAGGRRGQRTRLDLRTRGLAGFFLALAAVLARRLRTDHAVPDGDLVRPLARGHPQAFEDATGCRARTHRALTAQVVRAVGLGATREVMQVDGPLEALALRHAADVHLVARREAVDADLLAGREPVDVFEPDLAEHAHRRQVLEVTELRLRHAVGLLRPPEPELDGGVAVSFLRADLRHDVRLGDDDRRSDDRAVFLEVLEHAELAAKEHRLFQCRSGIGRLSLLVLLFHFRLIAHLWAFF